MSGGTGVLNDANALMSGATGVLNDANVCNNKMAVSSPVVRSRLPRSCTRSRRDCSKCHQQGAIYRRQVAAGTSDQPSLFVWVQRAIVLLPSNYSGCQATGSAAVVLLGLVPHRRFAGDYVSAHDAGKGRAPMPASHRRAITDIMACRTEALGGHLWRCEACEVYSYAAASPLAIT
jgi:Transposase zinc-binding domain